MTNLAPIVVTAPRLLVSQCLAGDKVRYDGGHKHQPQLAVHLWQAARPVLWCPEMAAGLGVPRPPIERRQGPYGQTLALAAPEALDAAARIEAQALAEGLIGHTHAQAQAFEAEPPVGAILKARSPSCGAGTSPLYGPEGEVLAMGDGVWVQALKQRFGQLIIVDESQLQTPADCLHFLRLVQLGQALKDSLLDHAWRDYLQAHNRHHQGEHLGLAEVAKGVGRAGAPLGYLAALPLQSVTEVQRP
ncbi:DUF523 domain-containing protein [Simiduia sp. 21SJ11W-1]|uniref:DUF523 domain-containing protein n=1 Tax=Simiduia sp. 21SJ11W-1 TaxID=2909669 RepID=UPI00209D03EA|nr:DUF523 domain-containing protein [Simiduia sp. 21SJ11W-1]UTA48069.1 DUF523 domain-containing protein [Simiduia sp. 21SJ11W-1]